MAGGGASRIKEKEETVIQVQRLEIKSSRVCYILVEFRYKKSTKLYHTQISNKEKAASIGILAAFSLAIRCLTIDR